MPTGKTKKRLSDAAFKFLSRLSDGEKPHVASAVRADTYVYRFDADVAPISTGMVVSLLRCGLIAASRWSPRMGRYDLHQRPQSSGTLVLTDAGRKALLDERARRAGVWS